MGHSDVTWQALSDKAPVEIIAPASECSEKEIGRARDYITKLGLTPRIPDNIIGDEPYHANTDAKRFEFLKAALESQDSSVIWCMRGGYGSARLLPMLEQIALPETPKLLVGFSDITALQLFITRRWGWPALHAPVTLLNAYNKVDTASQTALTEVLFGRTKEIECTLEPLNDSAKEPNVLHGSIMGGNMSIVQTSLATNWQINTENRFLFLEEVGERGYGIDRLLYHFTQAGIIEHAHAVIIGDITESEEKNGKDHSNYAVQRFAEHCPVPVLRTHLFGHGRQNHPLPFNTQSMLTLGNISILRCSTGVNA